MHELLASPRRARPSFHLAWLLAVSLVLVWSSPAGAAPTGPARPPTTVGVVLRVTDQTGSALSPASVMACPYEGGPTCDPDHLVVAPTNDAGLATLRLAAAERYDINAFVVNPVPPWACPGGQFNGNEFYFSSDGNLTDARPRQIAARHTFVVHRPSPADCVPVAVVDDLGNPLRSAGLMVCPLAADGSPCPAGPTFEAPDGDGVIRLVVDPAVTYRLAAFLANSGWPCPDYVSEDGNTFHFSSSTDILGADLIADGLTLVIRHPSASECEAGNAVVRVVDDAGNPLRSAGLMVCPLASDGSPCPGGPTFEAPDGDGVIRFVVDPAVTYRLAAFLANSGWPCPDYVSEDGNTFHFSSSTDILGADLIADGLTLVIHHPTASECVG